MCFKNLKKRYKEQIQKEKVIKIRERNEERLERAMNIVLGILLSGAFLSYIKISLIFAIVATIVTLIFYLFITHTYLRKYFEYTDELIRRENKLDQEVQAHQ